MLHTIAELPGDRGRRRRRVTGQQNRAQSQFVQRRNRWCSRPADGVTHREDRSEHPEPAEPAGRPATGGPGRPQRRARAAERADPAGPQPLRSAGRPSPGRAADRPRGAVQPLSPVMIVSPTEKPLRRLVRRLCAPHLAEPCSQSTGFGETPQGARRESEVI